MSLLPVPDLVMQRALRNSVAGHPWLAALPDTVGQLCAQWELRLGEAFPGGTSGYVVAATDAAGRACVLKIAMPLDGYERDAFARSVTAHQLAAGQGCARLLASDPAVPAILLERLGGNLADLGLSVPAILEVVADTLNTFWRPVDRDCGLPTGADQARWLAGFISTTWRELDRPGDPAVIARALELCARRAEDFEESRAVLVHGDAHGWNTLAAGDGTFKFVDAEGLRSTREHDLAIVMREYNDPLLAGDTPRLVLDRAELLARRCGVDAREVWEWGFVERVRTGLANLRDLSADQGRLFLEVARRCL